MLKETEGKILSEPKTKSVVTNDFKNALYTQVAQFVHVTIVTAFKI